MAERARDEDIATKASREAGGVAARMAHQLVREMEGKPRDSVHVADHVDGGNGRIVVVNVEVFKNAETMNRRRR